MIFFQRGSWKSYGKAGVKAYQKGNYPEAEKQFAAALKEAEGFGPQDPRVAVTLTHLAALYYNQGKYTEAEPLYKRALPIVEKALGPEDQGKYAEAEPLVKRALAIFENALGPEHPDVAASLENYAALLRETGRSAEAAKLEARAKAVR